MASHRELGASEAAVAAWVEAIRGRPIEEVARALAIPSTDVQQVWQIATGRDMWLQQVESLMEPIRCEQLEHVRQGARRKALASFAVYLLSVVLVLVLTAVVAPPSFRPDPGFLSQRPWVAVLASCSPYTTLCLLNDAGHLHFEGHFALLMHAAVHGLLWGALGPAFAEEFKLELDLNIAALLALVAMAVSWAVEPALRRGDPDDTMGVVARGSAALLVSVQGAGLACLARPHLTLMGLKAGYYALLLLAGLLAVAESWTSAPAKDPPSQHLKVVREVADRASFGLRLGAFAQQLQVMEIRAGSAAQRSGVRVGDILVEVAGRQVTAASLYDVERAFRQPRPLGLVFHRA